ncbi:MAG: hypothetical protein KY476_26700, partial [Planctomycetes bacterium]|nr:hypothetical protein [Planctomycetota bacterium]
MTVLLHILVCGPGAERAASAIDGGALRAKAHPSARVCDLDAATLNRQAEQVETPAIAFADAGHLPAASSFNAAATTLAKTAVDAGKKSAK